MDVEVTALAEDERVLCNKDDGFPWVFHVQRFTMFACANWAYNSATFGIRFLISSIRWCFLNS
jgi:hypothetical protein